MTIKLIRGNRDQTLLHLFAKKWTGSSDNLLLLLSLVVFILKLRPCCRRCFSSFEGRGGEIQEYAGNKCGGRGILHACTPQLSFHESITSNYLLSRRNYKFTAFLQGLKGEANCERLKACNIIILLFWSYHSRLSFRVFTSPKRPL